MASIDSLSILITASTASATTKIQALTKALTEMGAAINALDVSKFERLSAATGDLSQSFSNLKGLGVKEIKAIAKATQSVEQSKGALDPVAKAAENVAEETKEISANTDMAAESIKKFDATPLDAVAGSMEKVSSTLSNTAQKMGAFKTLLAKTKIIIPTEGLEKVDKRIEKLKEKIEDLQDKLNFKSRTQADYVNSEEMEKDQQKIEGLINELERLKLKKQELESHGGFRLNPEFGSSIVKANKTLADLIKKVDTFISKIRSARTHTKNTAKSTNDFSLASMKLAKELTRVTKMLKLMVTRMILRKVIQNVIDGFKNLIQYSSETNAAVSMLWNSFRQLGNSVAAAANPLLTALAPVLNYLIQLCIKLVNAINQVISALMGRTTWTKAKKLSDDYGASLDKSNKSAKELKRTILGFDELNVLQDNKDSGGGAGGTAPADMFEEAKIESKWKNLADKLKSILRQLLAPIKKAWENVGDEVVAAWTGAFKSVKKLLSDIGRDFLKVWNQPRTVQMLETILLIFKDIGGIVKYLADGLDKAWNTNHTGLKILSNIRDIFLDIVIHIRNMSFATLMWAKNLNFTPLLEAFKDWVVSMKPVVDAIAGAFEDFYIKVLLPLGKWSIEKGLPELIQVFTDFNNKVEWEQIRERLNRVWDALEPFAETVGEGLVDFIRDISDALADFVNSDKWDAFIDTLIKWMENVKPEDISNGLKMISVAFLALKGLTFLTTVVSGISALSGALSGLVAASSSLGVVAIIIASLTIVIYSFIESFGGVEGAVSKLQESFDRMKKAFDDMAQSMDLSKRIEKLKDSFKDLAKQLGDMEHFWTAVIAIVEKVGTIIGVWLVENLSNVITAMSALVKTIGSMLEYIEGVFEVIVGIFTLNGDKIKDGTSKMWQGIKDTYKNYSDWVASILKGWAGTVVGFFKGIKYALIGDPIVVDMWEGIKKIFLDSINKVISFVKDLKKNLIQLFMDIMNKAFEIFNRIFEKFVTFKADVEQKVDEIRSAIKGKIDDIRNDIAEFIENTKRFFDVDNWTFDGIAEGLKKSFDSAKNAIKGVWNDIADTLNGEYQIGGGTFRIHLPRFYATGGFPDPEDGWFRASHGEMLGKFDNGQSVVANNEQIVDGIRQGVYEAVSMAMSTGQGGTSYINNTIQVDGETIARAVTKGQKSIDRRYSPTMA